MPHLKPCFTCDRTGGSNPEFECKRCLPFATPVASPRALPLASAFSPYAESARSRGRSCRRLRCLCSRLCSSSTSASFTQVCPSNLAPHGSQSRSFARLSRGAAALLACFYNVARSLEHPPGTTSACAQPAGPSTANLARMQTSRGLCGKPRLTMPHMFQQGR